MSIAIAVLFVIIFACILVLLLFVKVNGWQGHILRWYSALFSLLIVLIICLVFHANVGKPLMIGNAEYSPFDNGKIFQTYWTSTRGNEKLFSVIEIKGHDDWTEKDTLAEVFYRTEPIIKPIPELFVVFDNNFYRITEQQKNEILKIKMVPEQIKNYIWMK